MNFDQLRKNCQTDIYKNKQPYVKSIKGQKSFYDLEEERIHTEYTQHCREAVQDVLGPVTDKQFGILFSKAWEDGHSSGYYEVVQYLEDLVYFIREWNSEKVALESSFCR
jgi:hypothetical protein